MRLTKKEVMTNKKRSNDRPWHEIVEKTFPKQGSWKMSQNKLRIVAMIFLTLLGHMFSLGFGTTRHCWKKNKLKNAILDLKKFE